MKSRVSWIRFGIIIFTALLGIASCKKNEEVYINPQSPNRLVEYTVLKDGENYGKVEYIYHNGKLINRYAYRYEDGSGWVNSERSIYKCWSNNFMTTEYEWVNSNWVARSEVRTKFCNNKPIEIISSTYKEDLLLMTPLSRWQCLYSDENLAFCNRQDYENGNWVSRYRKENIYTNNQLTRINAYSLVKGKWVITEYSDMYYEDNLMKRIRVFKKSEDKFHLHEVRHLYYSGDLLLECNCYLPEIIQDSLYLDCSTQYEYNIMGDVVHESNFNDGSLFEKFYTYEDSCGNFKSTIGAICCFHNFPLKLPISPK